MKTNPDLVFKEEFDGTANIFNPEDGQVFGLNQTGCFIWKAIVAGKEFDRIVSELKAACGGETPANIDADVKKFIADLAGRGYLA
ncbi:MAG: PqqD family peptide modification chaperone [Victivallaceae bacterium]|nr:PqqD family peptide modification chaperone [Victivallaceae bacterium]